MPCAVPRRGWPMRSARTSGSPWPSDPTVRSDGLEPRPRSLPSRASLARSGSSRSAAIGRTSRSRPGWLRKRMPVPPSPRHVGAVSRPWAKRASCLTQPCPGPLALEARGAARAAHDRLTAPAIEGGTTDQAGAAGRPPADSRAVLLAPDPWAAGADVVRELGAARAAVAGRDDERPERGDRDGVSGHHGATPFRRVRRNPAKLGRAREYPRGPRAPTSYICGYRWSAPATMMSPRGRLRLRVLRRTA